MSYNEFLRILVITLRVLSRPMRVCKEKKKKKKEPEEKQDAHVATWRDGAILWKRETRYGGKHRRPFLSTESVR